MATAIRPTAPASGCVEANDLAARRAVLAQVYELIRSWRAKQPRELKNEAESRNSPIPFNLPGR